LKNSEWAGWLTIATIVGTRNLFFEPARHQVHGIIARRCHECVGTVDPRFLKD
jgi:hypothetical protein